MAYCGQCGNGIYEGDQFCGSCGAVLLPDFQDSDVTEEIPSQPRSPQHTPARNGTRPLILVASIALVLLVLGVGAGAATSAGIGPLATLMGQSTQSPEVDEQGNSPEAVPPPTTVQEETLQAVTEPEPEQTTDGRSALAIEEEAQQAVEDYYEAVNDDDWTYTYAHLDSEMQSTFTEEEWARRNQWFEDTFPTTSTPVSIDVQDIYGEPYAEVERELAYDKTGTSDITETQFVYRDEEWVQELSGETLEPFMPDASFEEFVEANGG